jgi:hypothetical protein
MKVLELKEDIKLLDALELLRKAQEETGIVHQAEFSGKQIYSLDSDDEAYLRVVGKSKEEFEQMLSKKEEENKQKQKDFELAFPGIVKDIRKRARCIIDDRFLNTWDEMVPLSVDSEYKGEDLIKVLEIAQIFKEVRKPIHWRFKEAAKILPEDNDEAFHLIKVLIQVTRLGEEFGAWHNTNLRLGAL